MKNNKLSKRHAVLFALIVSAAGAALWLALPLQTGSAANSLPAQADSAQSISAPGNARTGAAENLNAAQNSAAQQTPAPDNASEQAAAGPHSRRQPLPAEALAELMQRRLTPAMRREINQRLRPDNQPPRVRQSTAGAYVDLSDRASSVMIAIIDDNNNTVVADITQPIATE